MYNLNVGFIKNYTIICIYKANYGQKFFHSRSKTFVWSALPVIHHTYAHLQQQPNGAHQFARHVLQQMLLQAT